jgi:uncharacterized beta-barrel protein YwiB (DUF1934 family)
MKTIKKKFDLLITSEQSDYRDVKEVEIPLAELADYEDKGETCEFYTEAVLTVTPDGQYSLSYDESELTGMEGAVTSVIFNLSEPTLVTLMRTGAYRMAMVFEEGKRHICTYQTPYMPIEMAVATKKLENTLSAEGGHLYAEYSIDAGGMRCERAKIRLEARESK